MIAASEARAAVVILRMRRQILPTRRNRCQMNDREISWCQRVYWQSNRCYTSPIQITDSRMDFVRPRLLLAPRLPASNLIRNTEIPSMFNPSTSVLGTRHRSLRSAVVPCWCTLLIVTTLTGCAGLESCHHYVGSCKSYVRNGFKVGPEYCKPAAPVADGWIDEYDERVRTELPNYADWWSVFNDPVLDRLMEETYQQNWT